MAPVTLEDRRAKALAAELRELRDRADRVLTELEQLTERTTQTSAPSRPARASGDKLPFRSFNQLASGKKTESRRILARQDTETLQAALEYERAHRNRKGIIDMIEVFLTRRAEADGGGGILANVRRPGRAPRAAKAAPSAPAADGLPFPEYAQVASSKGTQSRHILRDRTVEELQAALSYERANQKRVQIINMIETQLRKKQQEAVPAPAAKRAAKPKAAAKPAAKPAADGVPFRGFEQLASSKQTQSRRILAKQDADTLAAALEFERSHQNRVQVARMIETALHKAQAAQAEADLPFAGFEKVASSRQTESKRLLAKQDLATLEKAREFEAANRNRRQVLNMIDAAIARHGQQAPAQTPARASRGRAAAKPKPAARPKPAAAPAADGLPFPEYAQVASSKETASRKILAPRSEAELEQALAFEQATQNRNKIINLIETQLRKKRGEVTTGRRQAPASTSELPFPEYDQVASSKQTQSRAVLGAQDIPTLERTLEFEQATQNRRQVINLIEAALRRKQGMGLRRAGEVPEGVQMPFPGFEKVASSKQTESRHILNERSEAELENALEFERSHQQRRQVERLIEGALNRKRGISPAAVSEPSRAQAPASSTELPFAEYAQVASSKETASRKILAPRSEAELEQALAFERGHQNRNKIINLIETQLRKKRGEVTTGRRQAAAAPAAATADASADGAPLPFAGYDQVASSRRTESRALLIGQPVETLRQALDYEKGHQNRVQIITLIETIVRQKESGTVRASAKANGEPVKRYDSIPTNLILQSIRDGVFDTKLTQTLAYESSHQNRSEVTQALQERMSGAEGPVVSPTGREWKGKEPFRGYGSIDHSDSETLKRELGQRSSAELRRVEQAERRQDFPAQEAIDAAAEILAERSGSREAVPA